MLHPDQTFTIPIDDRRSFAFRYGSAAEYMILEDKIASIETLKLGDIYALARERLANPVDEVRLAETVTPNELVTLLVTLAEHQTLSELQAKKSRQPSPSSGASSAAAATPEPECATK